MNELSNIQFYQVYKKHKLGGKRKKMQWERRVSKSNLFEQKVKRIREIAAFINKNIA